MDFDGNGRTDVLSGSWPGELYLFRRQADGSFAARETIQDKAGNDIKVGSASVAFAVDWNGNDRLDLLVGTIDGRVYLILNEGTRAEPAFGEAVLLEAGGREIRVPGGDAGPVVADWDGDGHPDLLVGAGDGSVLWYRNIGTRTEPELAAGQVLVAPGGAVPDTQPDAQVGADNPLARAVRSIFAPRRRADTAETAPAETEPSEPRLGRRVKICVTDWHGNGRLDLLAGDFSSQTVRVEVPDLTEEEQAAKDKAQKRSREVLAEIARLESPRRRESAEGLTELEETREQLFAELRELQRELSRHQPVRHEFHGWVWLFERQSSPGIADLDPEFTVAPDPPR